MVPLKLEVLRPYGGCRGHLKHLSIETNRTGLGSDGRAHDRGPQLHDLLELLGGLPTGTLAQTTQDGFEGLEGIAAHGNRGRVEGRGNVRGRREGEE